MFRKESRYGCDFTLTLCVLAALHGLCVVSLVTLTHYVCCLTQKVQHVCNMLVFTCRYNMWHVLFELQHTACVVLFEHIMLAVSKQHAESVVPNLQAAQTMC